MPKKASTPTPKVMDVAHPKATRATETTVPLIVTNRSILKDPMVVGDDAKAETTNAEAPKPSSKKEPIIKKIQLQPLSTTESAAADVEVTATSSSLGAPDLPISAPVKKDDDAATKDEASDKSEPDSTPTQAEPTPRDPTAADKQSDPEKTVEAEPSDASVPQPDDKVATAAKDVDAPPTAKADETASQPAPASESAAAETTDPLSSDQLSTMHPVDAAAAQAAREAAEKQLALDKLMSEGTYTLPINSVEKRRVQRALLVLLIVVVLAIAGGIVALDAGYVHIDGLEAPTNFLPERNR